MAARSAPRPLAALLGAALACLAGSGCVLLPTLSGPVPRAPDTVAPSPPEGLVDVRAIIHCHSWQSHDSVGGFLEIAAAAREVGVRVVILTDHLKLPTERDGPRGWLSGVLFLPGFECRSDAGGSLLGLGVRAGVDPRGSDADLAEQVRARGGLIGVGHAEQVREAAFAEADAVELMNLHADTRDDVALGVALRALFLPPGAFFRSLLDRQDAAAAVYDALAADRPRAVLGACDAHQAIRLLGPYGGVVDAYRRVFRVANTHLLVRELSPEGVLEALRAGRSYAACELDQDASGFRFEARREGQTLATLGGTTAVDPALRLEVEAPLACHLRLLRDGQLERELEGRTLTLEAPRPGSYRVEAVLDGVPWVATAAIRISDLARPGGPPGEPRPD